MKIRSVSVAVLATLPIMIAGCGQEDPAQSQTEQAPAAEQKGNEQTEGVAWVDQMCGHVAGFALSQQDGPKVDKSSIPKFKESSIAQMRAAEQSASESVAALRKMPESPISGGNKVSSGFADGFTQVRDILTTAAQKAEQVDTTNKETFTAGMVAVQEELKKGEQLNLQPQFDEFSKNKELAAAAEQAPQCKQFNQQPPPQQGQPPQAPGQQPAPQPQG
ncbi:hypothetical protein [Parasphingorhabdus pacifica]